MKQRFEQLLEVAEKSIGAFQPTVFTAAYLFNAECAKITRTFNLVDEIDSEWTEHHETACKFFMDMLNHIKPFNKAKARLIAKHIFVSRARHFLYRDVVFRTINNKIVIEDNTKIEEHDVDTSRLTDEELANFKLNADLHRKIKNVRYTMSASLPMPAENDSLKVVDIITSIDFAGFGSVLSSILLGPMLAIEKGSDQNEASEPVVEIPLQNFCEKICEMTR